MDLAQTQNHQKMPFLIFRSLHEELDQQQGRPAAEPSPHHQQHPNNTGSSSSSNIGGNVEDVLFGWLLDKVPGERRQRQMAKLRVQQVSRPGHFATINFHVRSVILRFLNLIFFT
jgi:hypothetical protein